MRSTSKTFKRLALTATLLASVGAQAEYKTFLPPSGSCMSQGSWTQKALEQTDVIIATLDALKDDENCKAIAKSIGSGELIGGKADFADLKASEGAENSYRTEGIMQELSALRDVLAQKRNTEAAAQLNPIVAQSTVETIQAISQENQSSVKNRDFAALRSRLQNASAQSVRILSSLFQSLPQNEACMEKRPDLTAALVLGGIKVASAFAVGDMGMSVQVAQMTANFLDFLKNVKFSKIKKSLNQQKLWSEISCLTESAQASYCAVQDGLILSKMQGAFLNQSAANSPLEGFYLMSREVPAVTAWLQTQVEKLALVAGADESSVMYAIATMDQFNFTDESVVKTSDSVRSALMKIRAYLSRLYVRLEKRPDSQVILLSIVDTASRIDRIFIKLNELDRSAKELGILLNNGNYKISNLSNYSDEERNAQLSKVTDFIKTLIKELNIANQGSSFLSNRMATYVGHEYDVRLKNEDFSKYTNQLVVSARGSVTAKLKEYVKFNIAEVEADLNQASVVNMSNLENLEKVSISHIEDYLVHLNKISGHSFVCSNRQPGMFDIIGQLLPPILTGDCTWYVQKQDLNNEAENMRAKICIQTLGFKDYQRFVPLCRGAVLKTNQVRNARSVKGLQLEFRYNKLFKEHYDKETLATRAFGTQSAQRFSQVCLLRDYFRNNFVHWLTLKYQNEK